MPDPGELWLPAFSRRASLRSCFWDRRATVSEPLLPTASSALWNSPAPCALLDHGDRPRGPASSWITNKGSPLIFSHQVSRWAIGSRSTIFPPFDLNPFPPSNRRGRRHDVEFASDRPSAATIGLDRHSGLQLRQASFGIDELGQRTDPHGGLAPSGGADQGTGGASEVLGGLPQADDSPPSGTVTAATFVATIGAPGRLAKSRSVGAYAGLTSRRHQSGAVDYGADARAADGCRCSTSSASTSPP